MIYARARMQHYRKGFSILEISIVLVIIGTVIAAGTVIFSASLKQQQFKETQMKLEAIQKALLDFRRAYDRLPCPADVLTGMAGATNAATDASAGAVFGAQARLWFNPHQFYSGCTNFDYANDTVAGDYIPSANYIDDVFSVYNGGVLVGQSHGGDGPTTTTAMGMVPTRTLGLPDDYAIDGWGRRIMYSVDFQTTSPPISTKIPLPDWGTTHIPSVGTPRVAVYNASAANAKTYMALYVLMSYGPDGHGGFPRNTDRSPIFGGTGTPVSIASTNDYTLVNCNCFSATAFGGTAGYPTDSATVPAAYPSGYNGGLIGTYDKINSPGYSGYIDPMFFQMLPQIASATASGVNDFDDIVVFGTRSDLLGYGEF